MAIKRLFDPNLSAELKAEYSNEVSLLARLRHPNVISLLACCPSPPMLALVMELCGKSVYDSAYIGREGLGGSVGAVIVQCARVRQLASIRHR